MLASDRVAAALARLDAPDRALLELSVRRRLRGEEIAAVLRVEPAEVARRREEALAALGTELGLPEEDLGELREQLSHLDDEHWRGGAAATTGDGGSPAGGRRRSGALAASVLLLLTAGGAALVAIALGGGKGEDRAAPRGGPAAADRPTSRPRRPPSRQRRRAPKPRSAPARAAGPVRTLQRLNGTNGRGTAQLRRRGRRAALRLRVSGFLRPSGGGYAVWLFNSRDDSRRLYATGRTAIARDIPLPREFTRYRFVEVARAIPELNSGHSGISLLRVPVSALRRGAR